jgi:DnaJ-class molecular chaperone
MDWKIFDPRSQKIGQKGEVLNKMVYRCRYFKSSGLISSKGNVRCPDCLGSRTVRTSAPAVICASYDGEGRAYLHKNLICNVCKGIINIESEKIVNCPVCKGTGRERDNGLSCLNCRGKAVVS